MTSTSSTSARPTGYAPAARPTGYAPGDYAELTADTRRAIEEALGRPLSIAMIWAQTTDGVIGDGGEMPWYLPEDLRHFKDSTLGYPVVMGRTSWEALEDPYRPLPGRDNYVITRRADYDAPGGTVVDSIPEAIIAAARDTDSDLVWILGGGQVYAQCMPIADRVVVTEIDMTAPERFSIYAPIVPPEDFTADATAWQHSPTGHAVDSDPGLRFRIIDYRRR